MSEALVSVIVPVYNTEEYLEECLESISNQTYKNLEIICIDDGSADNSSAILHNYQKIDPRLTIYKTRNQGQSLARNLGLEKSRGEFVCFIDSDDYIAKNMIEDALEYLHKDKSDCVIFLMEAFFPNGQKILCNYDIESTCVLRPKLDEQCMNFTNAAPCLFKMKLLKDNLLSFRKMIYEDWFFMANVICYCSALSFVNKVYYYYRRGFSENTTSVVDNRCLDLLKTYELSKEILLKKKLYNIQGYVNDRKIIQEALGFIKHRLYNADQKIKLCFLNKYSQILNSFNDIYFLSLLNKFSGSDKRLLQELRQKDFSYFFNPYKKKLKKHFKKFIRPIKIGISFCFSVVSYFCEIFAISYYLILFFFHNIKARRKI